MLPLTSNPPPPSSPRHPQDEGRPRAAGGVVQADALHQARDPRHVPGLQTGA